MCYSADRYLQIAFEAMENTQRDEDREVELLEQQRASWQRDFEIPSTRLREMETLMFSFGLLTTVHLPVYLGLLSISCYLGVCCELVLPFGV